MSSVPGFTPTARSEPPLVFPPRTPHPSSSCTTPSWIMLLTKCRLRTSASSRGRPASSACLILVTLFLIWAGTRLSTWPGSAVPSSACSCLSGISWLLQVSDRGSFRPLVCVYPLLCNIHLMTNGTNNLFYFFLPFIVCTDSWSGLCSSIYHYAAQISVSRCSQPLLMSRLENLLERVRLKSLSRLTPRSRLMGMVAMESVSPAYSQIPWDDVLMICIDHKLKDWQIPSLPVSEGEDILLVNTHLPAVPLTL